MQDSIFTKIVNGEIPCHKIYEDELTLAFLDIHPVQSGQVLVIPKQQVEFIWQLESESYTALMNTVQKVGKKLQEVFPEKARVGVHVEGLDVAHAHVKVFPFDTDEEFRFHPDMNEEPDYEVLAEIAKRLQFIP